MSKENRQFGREGGEIITDTVAHTGNFYAISFYEASQITAITITDAKGAVFTGNTLVGETLPAGYELYGKITSIRLASGACIAYKDA